MKRNQILLIIMLMVVATSAWADTKEQTDEKLYSYDDYVKNNSYLACEEGQWVYHVELCDKAGVEIPNKLPADNIRLVVTGGFWMFDGLVFEYDFSLILTEVEDYLKALPEKGGKGDYKFTYDVPFTPSYEGEFEASSHLAVLVDDRRLENYSCTKRETMQYSFPVNIKDVNVNVSTDGAWCTLDGRTLDSAPTEKGIYLYHGKKIYVK